MQFLCIFNDNWHNLTEKSAQRRPFTITNHLSSITFPPDLGRYMSDQRGRIIYQQVRIISKNPFQHIKN